MTITYIFRDPRNSAYSIEEIFRGIIAQLPVGVEAQTFYYNGKQSLWNNIKRLRCLKTDLYHITGDVNFLALFLPKKKVIITLHDLGHYKNLKGWRRSVFGYLWIRLPLVIATAVTCVSSFTYNDVTRFFPSLSRTIQIIPNPVPILFRYNSLTFQTIKPRILQVGTGIHKNLPTLFKAIAGINCILVIIGPLSSHLRSLIDKFQIDVENYSNLTQEEVYHQYVLCDVVSFVTTHEGFGMPVLEAQAVGRPVITTSVCSLPEVTNGTAAIIDDPMDADALRTIMLKIIQDPTYRSLLINAGLENIRRYDIKKIVQKYIDLYQSALS